MTDKQFKEGDRVKVEIEGVVHYEKDIKGMIAVDFDHNLLDVAESFMTYVHPNNLTITKPAPIKLATEQIWLEKASYDGVEPKRKREVLYVDEREIAYKCEANGLFTCTIGLFLDKHDFLKAGKL